MTPKTIIAGVFPFAVGGQGVELPADSEWLSTTFVPGHGIVLSFAVDEGAPVEQRDLLLVPHGAARPPGATFCGSVTALIQAERRILAPVGGGPAAKAQPQVQTLFVFLLAKETP